MRAIADASGLGRTTVYRHFPNREALVVALFERVLDESVVAVNAVLARADAPRDVFPQIAADTLAIANRFRFLAAHRDLAAQIMLRPREDPLLAWVEGAVTAGTLRPLGATWTHAMIVGLVMAATEEIGAGRETLAEGSRKLGETLVAAFAT
jgi:AcrR family transcriptional regulator